MMTPKLKPMRLALTARVLCGVALASSHLISQAALQTITVTLNGQAVAGAMVSVYVKGAKAQGTPGTVTNMGQRDKAFEPPVLIIQTGTMVNFPNFDTVRHHVYSFSAIHPFEIKLYAGTPAAPVLFDKPGIATLGCNIHDRMLGFIHVVDTPYFGLTNERGQLTLELPNGDHRARVWTQVMSESFAGVEQDLRAGKGPVTLTAQRP
jgi:plastocyanin